MFDSFGGRTLSSRLIKPKNVRNNMFSFSYFIIGTLLLNITFIQSCLMCTVSWFSPNFRVWNYYLDALSSLFLFLPLCIGFFLLIAPHCKHLFSSLFNSSICSDSLLDCLLHLLQSLSSLNPVLGCTDPYHYPRLDTHLLLRLVDHRPTNPRLPNSVPTCFPQQPAFRSSLTMFPGSSGLSGLTLLIFDELWGVNLFSGSNF